MFIFFSLIIDCNLQVIILLFSRILPVWLLIVWVQKVWTLAIAYSYIGVDRITPKHKEIQRKLPIYKSESSSQISYYVQFLSRKTPKMSSCPIFSVTTSGTSEYLIRRSLEIFAYGNSSTHNHARPTKARAFETVQCSFTDRYFCSRAVLSLTHSENGGWLSFSAKMAICFRIAIMWLVMQQISR